MVLISNYKEEASAGEQDTHFITTVKKQDEFDVGFAVHDPRPALQVVLVPREAVNQEAELVFVFFHRLLHRLRRRKKMRNMTM